MYKRHPLVLNIEIQCPESFILNLYYEIILFLELLLIIIIIKYLCNLCMVLIIVILLNEKHSFINVILKKLLLWLVVEVCRD